ncbi:uncharacterized protein LOC100843327 isoform X1 [Brachypodium distachyon]|uniref:Ubiquitin-like domain-containing protein n=3 Tax=Brachypodium distachyon TaxID=15368 RepID=I1HAE8_BRADI|nr:uncharacterized protein LOC100843327 isoform X1 [Brachypodium distachyon]XP_010229292.1 uncharacterized protein LOC100843327 isoform X1 [Brachypodium distachyon]KQK23943.1 hypothetical protein BRADI_1g77187v3 [Brachypodium distachyon]KQK23944.1 hypothetical protein BRADI_1g77187v3 [Brachypodium distachyon]PNT78305.1 hypothetical protein BRADI_1g77187v3 [Brachypodium distachyon]|eukprot:XP_003562176.1 uncharacterized protein LOC100843327 isoform X1 [Brachypodium distachyon]
MGTIKITLAVDRSRNRVLFADAGSDFVEILLSFLKLPLSAVQSIAGLTSCGCLTKLRDSVNHLTDSELLKVGLCHGMLLAPTHADEFNEIWNTETCLRGKERFIISDGWMIKPASTSSMLSLPQMFGSDGVGHGFEEVTVCVGSVEVFPLLKASLSSDTIFTDVFISKGTDDQASRLTVKPTINQKILHHSSNYSLSLPESKVKLFYDIQEKKVMYAECNREFVHLLLGFLTYPVGCMIKNTGASPCRLGRSFSNLYRSAIDLGGAGFLTRCLPKLFDSLSHIICQAVDCPCTKDRMLTCYCCHPELVEDQKYVVANDLLIHQASGLSVMKHWFMRDKAKVLEMDIAIGKQETAALLQAVLTSSSTALTDVFLGRLEEQSAWQKMQIFAKLPRGGKIITVEVARLDTIATVKSRIRDKVPVPAGCRHELVYGSRYLKDSCTVGEYNIVKECTIICEFYKK